MTRRARRLTLSAVLVVVLAAAAYTGWKAWQVNNALSAAVDDATALEASVRAGDDTEMDASFARLGEHGGRAADLTGGPTWSLLGHLPVVGDDARGVRAVSKVVGDLSSSGLRPLIASAGTLDGLLPTGGRV